MGRKPVVVDALGSFGAMYLPLIEANVDVPIVAVAPPGAEPIVLAAPRDTATLRDAVTDDVQWIHSLSTGVDGFPLELGRGRLLTCSRGSASVAIAEYVLAAMLDVEKRLGEAWITAPPAGWQTPQRGALEGKTVAIFGLGAIGTEVATRALAFGTRVVGMRRHDRPAPLAAIALVRTLPELVATADHLVIAAPATADTARLFDQAVFDHVKPGAHLINVARGSLVDQDALLGAVDSGRIGRATLDVVDPEPLPAGHPLYAHPAVRISPHTSWASPMTAKRVVAGFVDNLHRYLAGEPLAGVVDTDLGY